MLRDSGQENVVDGMSAGFDTRIRVVLFGGAYFEPGALRFLVALAEHAEIDLVGVICQGTGSGTWHRVKNVVRRRHLVALPVLAFEAVRAGAAILRRPRDTASFQRRAKAALRRVEIVPDIHSPAVLERVRAWAPDLGLIYGAPILRPELFTIPRLGTLGIHHGKVPEFRGKKTTFWAMHNGERTAGVTIQRVNAGLDRGEIAREGEVAIEGKSYSRVEAEVEALGMALYLEAILSVKRGAVRFRPQPDGRFPLYRQPTPRDILRLWSRVHLRRRRAPGT